MIDVLLLGTCGLERLADALRARGLRVAVAGTAQIDLARVAEPGLVYVDLFPFDVVAPLTVAAARDAPIPGPDLSGLRAIVAALRGLPVVYRGLRRPSAGTFGWLTPHHALSAALDALSSVVDGERVLDVTGLWARAGVPLDDVRYGMGHGEPLPDGVRAEADAVFALWAARRRPPIKAVVVDLDGTLIWGRITDDDFHDRNPAWLPDGEVLRHAPIEAWWKLRRGLHEALRVLAARGVAVALASRNDPRVVAQRLRKRPLVAGDAGGYARLYEGLPEQTRADALSQHPHLVDQLAWGLSEFTTVRIGHGPKSAACRDIAEELGIGLDTVAFIDDSAFERAEVARHAPEVLVLDGSRDEVREDLLTGARFVPWEDTGAGRQRAASWTSRREVAQASDLEAFLASLELTISLTPMRPDEAPRVRELIHRTNQLQLTTARPDLLDSDRVYVGRCRDRIADHGVVHAAILREGALIAWATSCRVLPHRVAAGFLRLLLEQEPTVRVAREDTGQNGATLGLIEAARGPWEPWIRVQRSPDAARVSPTGS